MADETGAFETTVNRGPSIYRVQSTGSELRIGLQAGDTVLWQDETVPIDQLPEKAQAALQAGDSESTDLELALTSLVETYAQRGG